MQSFREEFLVMTYDLQHVCSLEGIYICSLVNNISNAQNGATSVTGKRSKSFKKTGLYVYTPDRVHMYTVHLKT